MKKIIDAPGGSLVHARNLCQCLHVGVPDGCEIRKRANEIHLPALSDIRNIIQHGAHLLLTSKKPVVGDGESVCLILDSGDQMEALGIRGNGDLHIVIVKPPGSVPVILNHAGHRHMYSQFVQNLQGYIHLSPSSVHEEEIRQFLETGTSGSLPSLDDRPHRQPWSPRTDIR